MKLKILSIFSLGLLLTVGLNSTIYPQGFPNKEIQMIVPYPPGGGTDILFRIIAEELTKMFRVPVNVLNKVGGSGVVGTSSILSAKPDGYTVLGTTITPLTFVPSVNTKVPYNAARDFYSLGLIAHQQKILVVKSDSEFKSLEDVINMAKKKPRELTCGTSGKGADSYFALQQLNKAAKVNITFMPFEGGGETITNLLGGHISMSFSNFGAVEPYTKVDRLRVLAVTGEGRVASNPNVPTFSERGYPQVDVKMSYLVMAPKGLPLAIIDAWKKALKAVMESPKVTSAGEKLDFVIDLQTDSEKVGLYLKEQLEKYSKLAADIGIRE